MTAAVGVAAGGVSLGRSRPVVRRVLLGLLSISIVIVVVFALAEGRSPTSIALQNLPAGERSPAPIASYIKVHGLDRSLPIRLESFVSALLHGNLGRTSQGVAVTKLVMPAFWRTVAIVVPAFVL